MRTRHLRLVTQEHSDTVSENSTALSPFGPVRAGLTTSQTTNNQQLTVLLSSLERKIADLNTKSFTVLDTLVIATEGARVALSVIVTDEDGTDETA